MVGKFLDLFFRRLLRSREGNVAIVTAIVMPVLIGFCGLGAETGYWYMRQRVLQNSADIAAFDGDVVLRSGGSQEAVTTTATTDAGNNGWRQASGTIVVNTPPGSGSHQTNRSVEVLLTETETRFFTSIFTDTPVNISVRAVASYESAGPACMLGLDKSRSGTVEFWGNANAVFSACNIISNSLANDSFKVGGSADVTAPCVASAGGSDVTALLDLTSCSVVTTQAPQAADPYASVPAPMIPASCSASGSAILSPGKYCGGLTLQGNVTLNPGIYVIDGGPFKINANANISGSGVMFYLTNGATLQFNGNANITFSAPTSGTYSGLLFYGDRSQPFASNTLNGNNTSVMTGAVYFPSQEVQFLGNFSGQNGCLQVVADRIYYTGNGSFSTDCTGTGLQDIPTPGAVAVVE